MANASPGPIDRLIHEPARLALMTHLAVVEEADFVFLQKQTAMTPGNMSAHLGKLLDAEYIAVNKTFANNRPRTVYSLTSAGSEAFDEYLAAMRSILAPAIN